MRASKFQLITHVLCPYVQRSVIVLKEKGIAYERINIDLGNLPEWFTAISPSQKVPVLRINDDKVLFESMVICEYLNEITPNSLHSRDPLVKAAHRSWIEFGSGILDNIGGLYFAKDEKAFEIKRDELQNKFLQVERELTTAPYFSGKKFHMIDAVYGPIFRYFDVFETFVDLKIFDNLSKMQAWRSNLQQRESVQNAVTPEYPQLLMKFLRERDSFMSKMIMQ